MYLTLSAAMPSAGVNWSVEFILSKPNRSLMPRGWLLEEKISEVQAMTAIL